MDKEEIDVENIKGLIQIRRNTLGCWEVNFIGGGNENDPVNIGYDKKDQIKALKNALLNLAIDRLKYENLFEKIETAYLEEVSIKSDDKYRHLEGEKLETYYYVTSGMAKLCP